MFTLPELSYQTTDFGSFLSAESFAFHHGKHHAGYVTKLNAAIEGTEFADQSLDEIIASSREQNLAVFNNAAQHYNHSFFWNCLSVETQEVPDDLQKRLVAIFGSYESFVEEFTTIAATLFGSGWAWLVQTDAGELEIRGYKDADTPAGSDVTPILTIDVWEHAYYIDHRNGRKAYIDHFMTHINWEFCASQLASQI